MTHPLTDEILKKFDGYDHLQSQWLFGEEDMRSAYDKGAEDMLEQVLMWLKECPKYDLGTYTGSARLIHDLMDAMRPNL